MRNVKNKEANEKKTVYSFSKHGHYYSHTQVKRRCDGRMFLLVNAI